MYNFPLNSAADCIKKLTDSNRCLTCDKLNPSFIRYPCGHSTCEKCVYEAECCLFCISLPEKISHERDQYLSLRVQHVSELVSAFQDLYNVDITKQQNLSKRIKVENQLFPNCIQARNQYINKRTSFSKTTVEKKRKRSGFENFSPGENTFNTSCTKMENKNDYIRQWLNGINTPSGVKKNSRKPLADININKQSYIQESNVHKSLYRKRTHVKTVIPNPISDVKVPTKKVKKLIPLVYDSIDLKIDTVSQEVNCKNESDIVIDGEIIEIMDSPLEVIDKDKLACMAIIQAEQNKKVDDSAEIETIVQTFLPKPVYHNLPNHKIPFYRKSFLYKDCSYCATYKNQNEANTHNVTITVDNNTFSTTINLINCGNSLNVCKHSTLVQTDGLHEGKNISYKNILKNDSKNFESPTNEMLPSPEHNKENYNKKEGIIQYKPQAEKDIINIPRGVRIEDSDTDSDLSITAENIETTVDIHRSCEKIDYDVLSELDQNTLPHRVRHGGRGKTPGSTDSSDKENFDPNKMKKAKDLNKKCDRKKK